MAAATVTKTEYGFSVTGGTDATTIYSGRMWVKALTFMGNADNATAALTTKQNTDPATTIACVKFKTQANDLDAHPHIFFGDKGVPMNGLAVTLSNASDLLLVFLTS